MHIFEREVNGHRYRIAAQSVWDAERGRSVARQIVLGPAEPPPLADLRATQTVGTRGVGDVGALIWVAEQLDLVAHIDRACGGVGAKGGPSVGELAVAVAIQRACAPGPKRELGEFLDASLPRLSCLPGSAFSGQAFHRVAQQVTEHQLEQAQVAVAKAAVARFELSADVLAFDTTNFDTHIDTQTPGELARRGHAKSKRKDLRVVGLGVLVSETGHVPLLYRTYPGNGSDQAVLAACLGGLGQAHGGLDRGEARVRTTVAELDRTLVVVESQELLAGQKRGIAAALRKAKVELRTLEGLVQKGRLSRRRLEVRGNKALAREHLSSFVVTTFAGSETAPTLHWHVDAALRRELEKTRLGRRVLCTDRHTWTTGRIVYAFRGQWKVEELFRRAKKGGVVPWGPSHQWADGSLRLHTFATVLGLMLVSLAKIALGTDASARQTMESLAEIKVTLVRTTTGGAGRRPTVMLAPELTTEQRRAVKVFELERWAPQLFHV